DYYCAIWHRSAYIF
nr:immunoglobulin light chain junction region [Macaca mulatta]MOX78483.1 immunoglobulin light chain junction region [Macaca mulatta]MOX78513.1 immunoglobulin light chain junction region [Macaca mulatta]MOX79098.1 immunoglobulin light chain junction region [Macaca mulatta]MOX79344.1 immunoglobulin light chain junction region [Macaca mulatta]